jgi:hypothetical protein
MSPTDLVRAPLTRYATIVAGRLSPSVARAHQYQRQGQRFDAMRAWQKASRATSTIGLEGSA